MLPTLKFLTWPGPATIFEIGACEGEDTVKYTQAFAKAQFWLFEPLPSNFEKLQELLLRYPKINARAFCLALSDCNGTATFHVSSAAQDRDSGRPAAKCVGNKSSSLLLPRNEKPKPLQWLNFSEKIEVKTLTLDRFCKNSGVQQIDFIHMDVQGVELKVLAGATTILPQVRAIWMEVAFEQTYEGQPLEPETTRWMADRGFRKIHQVNYGPEGDALYYNMRLPLAFLKLIVLRVAQRIKIFPR